MSALGVTKRNRRAGREQRPFKTRPRGCTGLSPGDPHCRLQAHGYPAHGGTGMAHGARAVRQHAPPVRWADVSSRAPRSAPEMMMMVTNPAQRPLPQRPPPQRPPAQRPKPQGWLSRSRCLLLHLVLPSLRNRLQRYIGFQIFLDPPRLERFGPEETPRSGCFGPGDTYRHHGRLQSNRVLPNFGSFSQQESSPPAVRPR